MKRFILRFAPFLSTITKQLFGKEYTEQEAAIKYATAQWIDAINAHDVKQMASLYSNNTCLYATFKNKVNDIEGIVNYFTVLFQKPNFKARIDEQHARAYAASTGVNSGLYTFSYEENGKLIETHARFTFVYIHSGEDWKIVEHHSSLFPESPTN